MTRLAYEAARMAEEELHSAQADSGRTKPNPQSSEKPHTAGLKRASSKPVGAMTRLAYETARMAEEELHSAQADSGRTKPNPQPSEKPHTAGLKRASSKPVGTMTGLAYEAARIAEEELHSAQADSGRTKPNPQSSEKSHTAGLKRASSKPVGTMTRLAYKAVRIAEKELHSEGAVSSGTNLGTTGCDE